MRDVPMRDVSMNAAMDECGFPVRRPDDTRLSYLALLDYCLLGPSRSLRELHRRYRSRPLNEPLAPTRKLATVYIWSNVHDWFPRSAAYDAEQRRRDSLALDDARREAAMATIRLGKDLRDKAQEAILLLSAVQREEIIEDSLDGLVVVRTLRTDISPRDIAYLAKVGVELTRLALGESTSNVDMRVVHEVVERVARRLGRPAAEVMAEVEGIVKELPGGY